MNKVHAAIIASLRERSRDHSGAVHEQLSAMNDEQIARKVFRNYRSDRGLRLTNFGLQMMKTCYRSYDVDLIGEKRTSPELLYLDRNATLPYYLQGDHLILFESDLGIKIKMADGSIGRLIAIES